MIDLLRRWLRIGCLFGAVLGISQGAAGPAVTQADTVLPAEAAPVRLVFADRLPPLSYLDDGLVRGVLIDVASDIFIRDLGIPVEVALYPWERAQQLVRQGEADGFISISTPARREYAVCGSLPVLRATLHPLVRSDHPERAVIAAAPSLEALRAFQFITYKGNGWAIEHLADAGFDAIFAPDFASHIKGLAQGRGDIALVTATSGGYHLREFGLTEELVILPPVIDIFEYVLCIGKGSPHLDRLADFEAALGRKRNGTDYPAILQAYGLVPSTPY